MRAVEFHPRALDELSFWIREDKRTALRIMGLVDACLADPFKGLGKPEPLKAEFRGLWSRRITDEHRLVYRVSDDRISVLQCRYHYD